MGNVKLIWVNRIKGLSILMVVLYHSVITLYPYLTTLEGTYLDQISNLWLNFNTIVAPFRMPVFFFISGFLVYRYVNNVPLKECFDKRVGSVLWVLCVWLIIQTISIKLSNYVFGHPLSHDPDSNIVYSDNIGTFVKNLFSASTSLWYLYALILNFLAFNFFNKSAKLLLFGCLLLNLYSYFNFLGIGWGANSIFRNAIYYGLGCVLGPQIVQRIELLEISRNKVLLILGFLVSYFFSLVRLHIFLSLFSIFIIIKFFMFIDRRTHWALRGLESIGEHTLAVYVVHRGLLEFISLLSLMYLKAFPPILLHSTLLIYPVLSTLLCVKLSLWIEKFSKKYLRNVLFEKPNFIKVE